MINNLEVYLTFENIYLVANWGVVPFWLMLILAPTHGLTRFLVNSIIAPLLLGVAYIFVVYKIYLNRPFIITEEKPLSIETFCFNHSPSNIGFKVL